MEVQGIGTNGPVGGGVESLFGGGNVLGKDDFLKLLITQLSNQDPLEPQANEEFVAQLAQFSTLEQTQNMNETLQANGILTQSVNNALSASLIGKEIRATGNELVLGDSGKANIPMLLAGGGQATIKITDEDGQTVRTIRSGELKAGDNTVEWDGRDDQGNIVEKGNYKYSVEVLGADGEPVEAVTFFTGIVNGVKFVGGNAVLLVGDREVPLGAVIEIGAPPSDGA